MLKQWGVNGPFSKHTGAQICISIRPNIRVFAATLSVPPWSRHTHKKETQDSKKSVPRSERRSVSYQSKRTDGPTKVASWCLPYLFLRFMAKILNYWKSNYSPWPLMSICWSIGQSVNWSVWHNFLKSAVSNTSMLLSDHSLKHRELVFTLTCILCIHPAKHP